MARIFGKRSRKAKEDEAAKQAELLPASGDTQQNAPETPSQPDLAADASSPAQTPPDAPEQATAADSAIPDGSPSTEPAPADEKAEMEALFADGEPLQEQVLEEPDPVVPAEPEPIAETAAKEELPPPPAEVKLSDPVPPVEEPKTPAASHAAPIPTDPSGLFGNYDCAF